MCSYGIANDRIGSQFLWRFGTNLFSHLGYLSSTLCNRVQKLPLILKTGVGINIESISVRRSLGVRRVVSSVGSQREGVG